MLYNISKHYQYTTFYLKNLKIIIFYICYNVIVSDDILLVIKPAIIKHIYKVCKNFTLIRVDNQKVCVADDNQEEKGSHFLIGVEYVDYTSPEEGETVTAITQDLLSKNFVKFDREVSML